MLQKIRKTSYIDDEAVLTSSDEAEFRDSHSEGGSSDDAFDMSFVNDANQDIANTTDMHVKYLKTTKYVCLCVRSSNFSINFVIINYRSPQRNKGRFKIPKPPPIEPEIVFSQEIDDTGNDTYMNVIDIIVFINISVFIFWDF